MLVTMYLSPRAHDGNMTSRKIVVPKTGAIIWNPSADDMEKGEVVEAVLPLGDAYAIDTRESRETLGRLKDEILAALSKEEEAEYIKECRKKAETLGASWLTPEQLKAWEEFYTRKENRRIFERTGAYFGASLAWGAFIAGATIGKH